MLTHSRLPPLPPFLWDSESLLRLPPSLETLLSEKRFLSAVVLLVRCNKALRKPELLEVGALSDLRAWAIAQEGVRSSAVSPSFLCTPSALPTRGFLPGILTEERCAPPAGRVGDSDRRAAQPLVPQIVLYRRAVAQLHARSNLS